MNRLTGQISKVTEDGSPIARSRKARWRAETRQRRVEALEEMQRLKEQTSGKHPLHEERKRALQAFISSKEPELFNISPREQKRAHGKNRRHGKVRIYR